MRKVITGMAVSLFLSVVTMPYVQAQEQDKSVDELAIEGLSKLMDALSLFVSAIPQYEAPEILENGDIIIRRKNKKHDDSDSNKDKKGPDLEETST